MFLWKNIDIKETIRTYLNNTKKTSKACAIVWNFFEQVAACDCGTPWTFLLICFANISIDLKTRLIFVHQNTGICIWKHRLSTCKYELNTNKFTSAYSPFKMFHRFFRISQTCTVLCLFISNSRLRPKFM